MGVIMKKNRLAKNIIVEILIFAFSVLIFIVYNHSNINSPLADDNVFQWEPVIEKVFANIFAGKGIPFFNFYEFKGFDIFIQGYYGQLNPIMYLSYALSCYLFSFDVKVLTIYIIIMYGLGNVFMYKLLTEMQISLRIKAVMQVVYATPLFFFFYEFYYFSFNSFFFIPFFVLILYKTRDTNYEWFVPGIVLAASMLLGHVQYSSYYVIVYCIIQCVFAVQKKSTRPLWKIITGVGIFVALNSVYLMAMMRGSDQREQSGIQRSEFFDHHIGGLSNFKIIDFIKNYHLGDRLFFQDHLGIGILALFCFTILLNKYMMKAADDLFDYFYKYKHKKDKDASNTYKKLVLILYIIIISIGVSVLLFTSIKESFEIINLICYAILTVVLIKFSMAHSRYRDDPEKQELKTVFFSAFTIFALVIVFSFNIVLVAGIFFYCRLFLGKERDKINCSENEKLIHALCFAALFFMIFGAGYGQWLAILLSFVPVFNRFRYLYKCAFIYIPLLVIIGAVLLDKYLSSNGWRKKLSSVVLVMLLLNSCFNAVYICVTINSGKHQYINNSYYDYFDVDGDKESVEKRMSELCIDKNYRFLTFSLTYGYNPIEIASKICSHNLTKNFPTAFSVFVLSGYDSVFSWKGYEQSDHILESVILEYHLTCMAEIRIKNRLSNKDQEYTDVLHDQFVRNGVKYIIYPKSDEEYYSSMVAFADKYDDISIVSNEPWVRDYMIMELEGTYPICRDEQNEKINMNTRIDEISFDTDFEKPEKITLSMTYNEKINIEATDEKGNTEIIKSEPDEYGYLRAYVPEGKYNVRVTYQNKLYDLSVVFAFITLELSVVSVIIVSIPRKKKDESVKV